MKFRPSTGKRRIIGRKSHQLVPDEVPAVEVRGSRRPDEVPAVMPKSLPTTGVTRPNNVGRTFTLRRKLGHQRRSAAKTGQDWPPPQRSGGTPTFCYEVPLGAAARSCSGSAEADRGPVRTEHHGTKEEFSPGDFIKPRFSYREGFQEFFPFTYKLCQISFLIPEIRFQEWGNCYVRYRSGNPEQQQQLTRLCTLSLLPLPRGIKTPRG